MFGLILCHPDANSNQALTLSGEKEHKPYPGSTSLQESKIV